MIEKYAVEEFLKGFIEIKFESSLRLLAVKLFRLFKIYVSRFLILILPKEEFLTISLELITKLEAG